MKILKNAILVFTFSILHKFLTEPKSENDIYHISKFFVQHT